MSSSSQFDSFYESVYRNYRSLPIKPIDIVQALYDYNRQDQRNIISLAKDDIIYVMTKSTSGWWDGVICPNNSATGQPVRGWFPESFTKSTDLINYVKKKASEESNNSNNSNNYAYQVPSATSHSKESLNSSNSDLKLLKENNSDIKNTISGASATTSETSNNTASSPNQPFYKSNKSQLDLNNFASRPADNPATTNSSSTANSKILSLKDAENMVMAKFGKEQLYWLPQVGPEGKTLFYNSDLDIYCDELPFSNGSANLELNLPGASSTSDHNNTTTTTTNNNNNIGAYHVTGAGTSNNASSHNIKNPTAQHANTLGGPLLTSDEWQYNGGHRNFTGNHDSHNKRGQKFINFIKGIPNKKQNDDRYNKYYSGASIRRAGTGAMKTSPPQSNNNLPATNNAANNKVNNAKKYNDDTPVDSSNASINTQNQKPHNTNAGLSVYMMGGLPNHSSSLNLGYRDSASRESLANVNAQTFGQQLQLQSQNQKSSTADSDPVLSSNNKEVSQNIFDLSDLFIQHPKDLTTWDGLKDTLFLLLERCLKALIENDKQGFNGIFNIASKLCVLIYTAARLSHEKLVKYGFEVPIKKRLVKISRSVALIVVNGNLCLSLRELEEPYEKPSDSSDKTETDLNSIDFDNDDYDEEKFESNEELLKGRASSFQSNMYSDTQSTAAASIFGGTSGGSNNNNSLNTANKVLAAQLDKSHAYDLKADFDKFSSESYLQVVKIEMTVLKRHTLGCYKVFKKLSESSGEKHMRIPQVYPRFVTGFFSGGNWQNPFFSDFNDPKVTLDNSIASLDSQSLASNDNYSSLSASEIKRKDLAIKDFQQRAKRLVNLSNENLTMLTVKVKDLFVILDEILVHLSSGSSSSTNNKTIERRNFNIISLVYKALACIAIIMDIFESFDFSIFNSQFFDNPRAESGSVKSHSSSTNSYSILFGSGKSAGGLGDLSSHGVSSGTTGGNGSGAGNGSGSGSGSTSAGAGGNGLGSGAGTRTAKETGIISIAYPILIEFFEVKQDLHNSISELIMDSQALTAEDPSIFKVMKQPTPPTAQARSGSKFSIDDLADDLKEVLSLTDSIDNFSDSNRSIFNNFDKNTNRLIKKIRDDLNILLIIIGQLIEEKESLRNYAERVMHSNLDYENYLSDRKIDLSDKGYLIDDEVISKNYKPEKKKPTEEIPWYLDSDEEYDLYYDARGEIKGGTKEVLVTHLTNHENFDPKFNKIFLSTFRSMMTPGELVSLLIARFNIQPPEGLSFEEYDIWVKKKAYPIRLRCVNIMKMLLQKFWIDVYSEDRRSLELWLKFAQRLIEINFPSCRVIHDEIEAKLSGKQITRRGASGAGANISYSAVPPPSEPAPEAIIPTVTRHHKQLKLLDIDYVEFARQLTLKDFELYSQITLLQCLERVWKNKYGSFGGSKHITEFINNSNNLTAYVSHMVLRKHDINKRAKVIDYFIAVAEQCRQFNNFSSMTAVISSLASSPIHRLRKTWALIPTDSKKLLDNMNSLMDTKRNFNKYREMLKYVSGVPCVPFVGVYLTDLTFIANGTRDYLNGDTNVINFYKRAKMESIISNILAFQGTSYPFKYIDMIQEFICKGFKECPSADSQYQISLILEPRESASSQLNSINALRARLNNKADNDNGDDVENQKSQTRLSDSTFNTDGGQSTTGQSSDANSNSHQLKLHQSLEHAKLNSTPFHLSASKEEMEKLMDYFEQDSSDETENSSSDDEPRTNLAGNKNQTENNAEVTE